MYGFKTLPSLGKYAHNSPEEGMCVMELVSYINGEEFSDTPSCTEFHIASLAQEVNDRMDDRDRHLILQEFDRLFGTSDLEIPAYQQQWFDALYMLAEELMEENKAELTRWNATILDHRPTKGDLERSIRDQIMVIRAVLRLKGKQTPEDLMPVLSRVLDAADKALGRKTVEPVDRDLVEAKLSRVRKEL